MKKSAAFAAIAVLLLSLGTARIHAQAPAPPAAAPPGHPNFFLL